ncbi:rhombosortase [Burkholderia sp. JSH-S8]|nr:rhombosortase [Burkholderia sp. JSH-S8]
MPPDRGWLAICALVLGLQCLPPPLREVLVHDRAAIATGHAWRIVTGHFVHLGWAHAALNAACLAACAWLAGRDAGGVRTIVVLACATGGWLWFGAPQLARYAGLSGVVYGAAACALIAAAGRRIPAGIALAALVALAVRIGWQGLYGAPAAHAAWLGGPVAPAAHGAGWAAGIAWASARAWRSRGRRGRSNGRMDRRAPPAQNSGSSIANARAARRTM